jgi:methyl-accepting chemotaxis protein
MTMSTFALSPEVPSTVQPLTNHSVDVELLTIGKVLSVVKSQVAEASADIEDSVLGVCQGFQGMAKQATEAVNAATSSLGVKSSGTGDQLIGEMQLVMQSLVHNIHESCQFAESVSSRLVRLEARLASIEKTLAPIENLAVRARLVAMNGQIEAARLGEAGLAFSVVAQETKVLSLNAADTSKAIRELVTELVKETKETSSELQKRSQIDIQRFNASERQAVDLLQDIDADQRRMSESLSKTSEISSTLQNEISRAVMSMQFQDRVSQRLGHVIDTLQLLMTRAESHVNPIYEASAREQSELFLQSIAGHYTMDSERNVWQRSSAGDSTPGEEGAKASNGDLFDVELF